ncbi:MAG TPA: SgcJ/EcaC family oxidoreductase [Cyclobacteriaceae bacterium]|nr:SgcJ/EcaC family oxidoreductase [Cyclobacteriaceae bacterium]
MKAISLTLLAMALIAIGSYGQTNRSKNKNNTSMQPAEISTGILKTLEAAWNNANGVDYAKSFADPTEFVDIRGTLHKNSSSAYIGEAHQGIFNSIYKDSKIVYQLTQAIAIDPDVILVQASSVLDAPSGPLAGTNSSTITLLLLKTNSEWKIRSFHNTLVAKK